MKLLELEPRWFSFEKGGPRVGLTFLCPHCRVERLGVVFHHRGHKDFVWMICSAESFGVLTLMPSIDASRRGHWHGFITGGEVC
jgi:hypothetical protein